MKAILLGVVLLSLVFRVTSIGEVLNKLISVTSCRANCRNYPPNCLYTTSFAQTDLPHMPDHWQCPCPVEVGDFKGAILDVIGTPVITPNPDAGFFQDYVLVNEIDNPVTVGFADNTNDFFVGTRPGFIWHVDLQTGLKNLFVDLSYEVGFSGDRGLSDVKTLPNYGLVRHVMVSFTVNPNPPFQPDAEVAANQRIIRIDEAGGVHPANGFRLDILGAGKNDGVPVCYNTHPIGQMSFGHDSTLVITAGEGSHWNFDMGDWGQPAIGRVDPIYGNRTASLDAGCPLLFGNQSVGSWRAQIHYSLGGKVLRIAADSGQGICPDAPTGKGYDTYNPWCDGSGGLSVQSRLWAIGARNPYRMTMRPFSDARGDKNPGVFFFGDVGLGGYEEVNLVNAPGLNFGWPCWEGPMPSPMMRDSVLNDDPHHQFSHGCGGSAAIITPCGNITATPIAPDGHTRLNCAYVYKNLTSTMPYLYWTRSRPGDDAGYYTENYFQGMGFYGATTCGLTFYEGTSYPTRMWGQLFAFDYTENWIKIMYSDSSADTYTQAEDFADLIYTQPTAGAKVGLASRPDNGDICYLTLNGGEVRCFAFVVTNTAPVPVPQAVNNTGGPTGPVTVQFYADATADREHDDMLFFWQFGDGATSTMANPIHTYTSNIIYNASLTTTDIHGASDIAYLQVFANDPRPIVTITSPIPNLPEKVYVYSVNETILMNAVAISNGPVTWQWEYQLVHWSHYHPEIRIVNAQSFTDNSPPDESDLERNNVLLWARATDSEGLVGQDYIRISRPDWLISFGNHAPVASFIYVSDDPPRVGQPLYFDARGTVDVDVDRLTYTWYWGDGIIGDGVVTTHTYDNFSPSGYNVYLNVTDNWGASGGYALNIPVYQRQTLRPSADFPPGKQYQDFNVTLSVIQPGAVIYYELVSGNGEGIQVTPCSRLYTSPIYVPWVPGYNVTLLAVAILPGALESTINAYTYIMDYAPCDVLGFGQPGNLQNLGNLFCSNTVVTPPPGSYSIIPQVSPYGVLYTTDPPPYPTQVVTFEMKGLEGVLDPTKSYVTNTTMLSIWVDQNTSLGAVGLCRVSYDFTGDGTWDRNETFGVLSPDPLPGYENFNFLDPSQRFPPPAGITGGAYQPLVGGTVLVQLWTSIGPINNGTCPIFVQSGQGYKNGNGILVFSNIELPYLVHVFQPLPPVSNLPPSIPYSPAVCNTTWITGVAPTTGFSTTGFTATTNAKPSSSLGTSSGKASTQSTSTHKGTTQTEISVSPATILYSNVAVAVMLIGLLCKLI